VGSEPVWIFWIGGKSLTPDGIRTYDRQAHILVPVLSRLSQFLSTIHIP